MTKTRHLKLRRLYATVNARSFGTEITRRYRARGWTQQYFIRWTQLHATQIRQYEMGLCKPEFLRAQWIAECVGCTLFDMIAGANAEVVTNRNRFGMQLRIARKAMGLSTRQLADLVNLPYYRINRMETGYSDKEATPAIIRLLAQALDTTVAQLTRPPDAEHPPATDV